MTHIYAGAETSGLYRLSPGSEQWDELTSGLPEFTSVCGIAIHPDNPEVVFAGTQDGPYRSLNRGNTWERMDYPRVAPPVWSFMFRPGDPTVMYLGTAPGEIFRSTDSGESWKRLNAVNMGSNEVSMSFPHGWSH